MSLKPLASQKCVPCEGGVKPLTPQEFTPHLTQVKGWSVLKDKEIQKDYKVKDFKEALSLINKIGAVAEAEGHHPDIFLHNWNKVQITLSTHSIGGLSLNDFIVAAKIDNLL
jgi:4a-hydroxytetrahydrobiopterin dehydratase